MSKLKRISIAVSTALVALFASVFLFGQPVYAQEVEQSQQQEVQLDLFVAEPILERFTLLVDDKLTEVQKEAQEKEKLEEKKESLDDRVKSLEQQIAELKQKIAEKKAREAREAREAAAERERQAELARQRARVSQVTEVAPTRSYSSAGNTYGYGYCTWYVKNMRPDLPNSLGNANTWFSRAQAMGLPTGTTPRAGAVGTTERGALGHVVYVHSVNGDGTINISDMNYSGWNQVTHRTVDSAQFRYIYK